MAASSQILKEYLLAIGFKIDETSQRRFDTTLGKTDASAMGLAKKLLGVGVAAQAMVAVFAKQMEGLYYASKRTGATVDNIQALEFGAKQIGIQGGTMRAALEGMARALRANPGLQGLLESLGVRVEGRDKSDVMTDLVKQLKGVPFYVAQQYASMFGIDPDTLFMLQAGIEKLEKAKVLRQQMARDAGLDLEKASEAGMQYANTLGLIWEKVGLLKDVMSVTMLPYFQSATEWILKALDALTKYMGVWSKVSPQKQLDAGGQAASTAAGGYWDFTKKFWNAVTGGGGSANTPAPGAGAAATSSDQLFAEIEKKYNLPPGLLDKMWAKESSRGKHMLSGAGAQGHFQIMPGTQRDLGVKDPNDLTQAAEGAGKYMSQLLGRYGGDLQKALAAYNWGMGNVDRKGLGMAPWETQDYVTSLSGKQITLNQTTTINLATPDPATSGRLVASEQARINASIARNLSGSE